LTRHTASIGAQKAMAPLKRAISKRQAMTWVTTLVIVACVVALATYAWLSRTPPAQVTEIEISSLTGAVTFDYSIVEITVKAQLRDPNSAKFGPMLAYRYHHLNGKSGTAVCGSVSAKNETGEYDTPKEFVFISNPTSALIDPNMPDLRFVNVWKEYCTGSR
jgi:hypothetical protein